MVVAGELFSEEELQKLSKAQLLRVCAYLKLTVSPNAKNAQIIEAIMDFQNPKVVLQSGEVVRQSDIDDRPPMSVRVKRIYENRR